MAGFVVAWTGRTQLVLVIPEVRASRLPLPAATQGQQEIAGFDPTSTISLFRSRLSAISRPVVVTVPPAAKDPRSGALQNSAC